MSLRTRLEKLEKKSFEPRDTVINGQYNLLTGKVKSNISGNEKIFDTKDEFLEYVNENNFTIGLFSPDILGETDWEIVAQQVKGAYYGFCE